MMTRPWLTCFALCATLAVSIAAVPKSPKQRRLIEEVTGYTENSGHSTAEPVIICAKQTPCAWTIYKNNGMGSDQRIENSYCKCTENQECIIVEKDTSITMFVHHCRDRSEDHNI